MSSLTLAFFRIPAVSVNIKSLPNRVYRVLMASLVVPGMSVTMVRSSPNKALIKEDLPALGLPKMAILGSPLSDSSSSSSSSLTTSSSKSPVPQPLEEATGNNLSVKPNA